MEEMSLTRKQPAVLPVYYYDLEYLDRNIVEKVSTHDRNIFQAYNELSNMKRMVSFYGDREQLETIMSDILGQSVELSLKNPVLSGDEEEYKAIIYIVFDYQKATCYALLVCKSSELFDKKPLNKESLIVSMQRYLQDVSGHVFIAPSRHTIEQWSSNSKQSPFNAKRDTIIEFEIRENNISNLRIEPIEVNAKRVEEHINECTFELDNNYSNSFYSIRFVNESDLGEKMFKTFRASISTQILKISERIKYSTILKLLGNMDFILDEELNSKLESIVENFNQKVTEIKEKYQEGLLNKLIKEIFGQSSSKLSAVIQKMKGYIGIQSNNAETASSPTGGMTFLKDLLYRSVMYHIDSLFSYENDRLVSCKANVEKILNAFLFDFYNQVYPRTTSGRGETKDEYHHHSKKTQFDTIDVIYKKIHDNINEYENDAHFFLIQPVNDQFRAFQNEMDVLNKLYKGKKDVSDYFEVRRFTANFVRSDQSNESAMNINYVNKLSILTGHVTKSLREKSVIRNLTLHKLYPTKNMANSILIFKYNTVAPYSKSTFSVCFMYNNNCEKLKRLFGYELDESSFYVAYSLSEETLFVFSLAANTTVSLNRVDSDGTSSELNTYYLDKKLTSIKNMIYLACSQLILLISDDKLYELRPEEEQNRTYKVKEVVLRRNDEEKTSLKRTLLDAQLLYSGSGNFFALKYATNQIEFFDLNYVCCDIGLSNEIGICSTKLFSSESNIYILNYFSADKRFECSILPNCGNDFSYQESKSDAKIDPSKIQGNPILDYIFCSYEKYGPNMDFLNGFTRTNYYFLLPDNTTDEETKTRIVNYSKTLFEETIAFNFEMLVTEKEKILKCIEEVEYDSNKMKILARILISRVPIQICTIENNNIIPMIDGKGTIMTNVFEKMNKIEDKAKYVSFGYIEKIIDEFKRDEDMFVCCVIGRQSSGKSYLMNRIFGTRFAVASTRCTDGIWMSYSCVGGHHIIVFDCEGLFSTQRKEIEEIKMMTLLTALCNFTYLNQDLSFNRSLNSLLNNLSKSIGRIKGENLFKGKLVWTIRDVSDQMREGAKKEFLKNLTTFKNNEMTFLRELFCGEIALTCLNNFEKSSFKREIDECRELALEKIKENREKGFFIWKDGHQLLTSLKIILIQLYADDDSSLDEIQVSFMCDELREQFKEMWQHIDRIRDFDLEKIPNIFEFRAEEEPAEMMISFEFSVFDIALAYEDSTEYFKHESLEAFFQAKAAENSISYEDKHVHNRFYEAFNKFMEHFARQRRQAMMAYAESEIKKRAIPEEKSKAFLRELDDYFRSTLHKLAICLNVCSKCYLVCSKLQNHRKINEEKLASVKKELETMDKIGNEDRNKIEENIRSLKSSIEKTKALISSLSGQIVEVEEKYSLLSRILGTEQQILIEESLLNDRNKEIAQYSSKYDRAVDEYIKDDVDSLEKEAQELLDKRNELFLLLEDIKSHNCELELKFETNINGIEINANKIQEFYTPILEYVEKCHSFYSDIHNKKEAAFKNKDEHIRGLKSSFEKKQEEIKSRREEFDLIKNEISTIEEQVENISKSLIEKQTLVKDLKEQKEPLDREISSIETGVSELQIDHDHLKKSIMPALDENNVASVIDDFRCKQELNLKIDNLKDKVEKNTKLKSSVESDLSLQWNSFLEEQNIKVLKDVADFENKIKINPNLAQIYQPKLDKLRPEQKAAEEKLNEQFRAKDDIKKLKENLENIDAELARDQKRVDELATNLKEKEASLAFYVRFEDQLKKIVNEEMLANGDRNLSTEKQENPTWPSMDDDNDDSIIIIKSDTSYSYLLEGLINEANKMIIESNTEINKELDDVCKMLDEKKKELQDKREASEVIKTQLEEQEKEIAQLEIQLENRLADFTKQNERFNNLETEISSNENELSNVSREIDEIEGDQNKEVLAIETMSKLIQNTLGMKDKLKSLKNKHDSLSLKKQDYEKKQKEFSQLKTEIAEITEKVKTLKETLKELDSQKAAFKTCETSTELLQIKDRLVKDLNQSHTDLQALDKQMQEFMLLSKKYQLIEEKQRLEREMKESCSCSTDHLCESTCFQCPDKKCAKKAHHSGTVHICDLPSHKCKEKCQIRGCAEICRLKFDHSGEHNCEDKYHMCKSTCKACTDNCQYSINDDHAVHRCKSNKCNKKCVLCNEDCACDDHFHDFDPNAAKYFDKTTGVSRLLHLCGKEHNCQEMCAAPGVCKIEYIGESKEYVTKDGRKIDFIYQRPKRYNEKCSVTIPANCYSHEGVHTCNKTHRCEEACPDCKSYCKKDLNHAGLHEVIAHRNKENCYFTNQTGDRIYVESEETGAREYNVRDESIAENCYSSCKNRKRGHTHLVRCKAEPTECLADNKRIFHVKNKYVGFEEVEFDELNCIDFWKHFNFTHPLAGPLDTNKYNACNKCNFYCSLCADGDKKTFCSELVWHSTSKDFKDHSFSCSCQQDKMFTGLDICFVIDATGSMASYIAKSKEAIKKIVDKSKSHLSRLKVDDDSLKIAVVGYRDHCDGDEIIESIDFTSSSLAVDFLDKLKDRGGGDTPEAVADGLKRASQLKWRENSCKLIFLVLDAPPHGRQFYTSGDSYPDGCPCGNKVESLLKDLDKRDIKINVMKLNSILNMMETVFKRECPKIKIFDLDSHEAQVQFEDTITNVVCKILEDKELTVAEK